MDHSILDLDQCHTKYYEFPPQIRQQTVIFLNTFISGSSNSFWFVPHSLGGFKNDLSLTNFGKWDTVI